MTLNDPGEGELDNFIEEATIALNNLEHRMARSPYYVQSVVIAAYGEPQIRLRWNAETGGYDREDPGEGDAR